MEKVCNYEFVSVGMIVFIVLYVKSLKIDCELFIDCLLATSFLNMHVVSYDSRYFWNLRVVLGVDNRFL